MESKTKHRILGTIVMAALVIALLPLFHSSNNDIKLDKQMVSAPSFPDQLSQAGDNSNPEFRIALANQQTSIPIRNNQDNDNGVNQLPDDTINPNASRAYNNANKHSVTQESVAQLVGNDNESPVLGATKEKSDHAVKASQPKEPSSDTQSIFRNSLESELQAAAKPTIKKSQHSVKTRPTKIEDNGLFKLKSSAWVIQLGNYKNKTEALRLVNRLRANGYSAFIQEASVGTRVYVGPESKETIARSIAARLAYEMKIQGLVISYKPLIL